MNVPRHTSAALLCALLVGCGGESTPAPRAEAPGAAKVSLVVDFDGEPETKAVELSHRDGASLFELMTVAREEGALRFEATGSGDTAFLTSIEEVANEGGGNEARNWLFWVNDELSDVGVGVHEPEPGDEIRWRFVTSDVMTRNE